MKHGIPQNRLFSYTLVFFVAFFMLPVAWGATLVVANKLFMQQCYHYFIQ